jgi:hypothetical protein
MDCAAWTRTSIVSSICNIVVFILKGRTRNQASKDPLCNQTIAQNLAKMLVRNIGACRRGLLVYVPDFQAPASTHHV